MLPKNPKQRLTYEPTFTSRIESRELINRLAIDSEIRLVLQAVMSNPSATTIKKDGRVSIAAVARVLRLPEKRVARILDRIREIGIDG